MEVAPGVESFCHFFDATAVRGAWQALTNSTEQWDDHMLNVLQRMFRLQGRVQKEIEEVAAARPQTRAELYRRLHRARDYLVASLNEPLDLEKAASAAHLTPFHFHRAFKSLFRVTSAQYLKQRRLERAEQLLRSTNLSVLEICHEVGFQSLGSFTALFRRHTGHTPGVYRRTKTTEGN